MTGGGGAVLVDVRAVIARGEEACSREEDSEAVNATIHPADRAQHVMFGKCRRGTLACSQPNFPSTRTTNVAFIILDDEHAILLILFLRIFGKYH